MSLNIYKIKEWFNDNFFPSTNNNHQLARDWLRNQTKYPVNSSDGKIVYGFQFKQE